MARNTRNAAAALGDHAGDDRRALDGRHAGGAIRGVVSRHHRACWCSTIRSVSSTRAGIAVATAPTTRTSATLASDQRSDLRERSCATIAHISGRVEAGVREVRAHAATRRTLSADWPRLAMVQTLIYQQMHVSRSGGRRLGAHQGRTLVFGGDKDGPDFPRLAKHIADTIPGRNWCFSRRPVTSRTSNAGGVQPANC